jgi:hypothetical protein
MSGFPGFDASGAHAARHPTTSDAEMRHANVCGHSIRSWWRPPPRAGALPTSALAMAFAEMVGIAVCAVAAKALTGNGKS